MATAGGSTAEPEALKQVHLKEIIKRQYYSYWGKVCAVLLRRLTTKTRGDVWLAGFLKDLNKSVEFVVVTVHSSLKVA